MSESAPRYTVIPRTLIFLTCGESVLLLRGSPTKRLWAGKYNGLGGHVEPGETPYAAAARELYEEAGVRGVALELRAVVHVELPEPPGVMLFVFVGKAPRNVELRPSDEGTPVWIDVRELHRYPLVEDLPLLLPQVLAGGALIYGRYAFTREGFSATFESESTRESG